MADAPHTTETTAPEAPADAGGPRADDGQRVFGVALPWWLQYVVLAVLFVALAASGQIVSLGTLSLLTTILMVLVVAQGWNLLGGYAGYLNLGMAAFFGTGAYASAILFDRFATPMVLTLPVAALVAGALALLVGVPSLRLRGAYFAILTLVLGFLVRAYALVSSLTRGAMGLYLTPPGSSPRMTEQIFFYSFLALAGVAIAVAMAVQRSKFGYALRAIREDEDAAEVLGVRTMRVKLAALLLGAALAGVAGGLYAFRVEYLEPTGTFDVALSIDVVLMCVIGGVGAWQGPLIGVPLVLALSEVLRVGFQRLDLFGTNVPVESNRVVLGLVLVVVALFARRGIVGLFRRAGGRRLGV
jgi:branched-chain amino acid transport system permease protein